MIYKISTPLKLCPYIFWLMMSQNYIFIHCVPEVVILLNELVS